MKRLYAAGAVLCVLLAGLCISRALPFFVSKPTDSFLQKAEEQPVVVVPPPEVVPPEETEQSASAEEPYISPIDFAELQSQNPDIYAWLHIPEAETSYPVVQNPEDDSFYMDHGSDRKEYAPGAIFSEHMYTSIDFNDPVTILYGHHYKSGIMFGNLQKFYSIPENFYQHNKITVYLPDRELEYQVFAATRYDNRHILDNYDFRDAYMFDLYFDSIFKIRDLSSNIDQSCQLTPEDKVLILSTCLEGDYSQRYLVFAKLL